jgi:uncharacterized protein YfeS
MSSSSSSSLFHDRIDAAQKLVEKLVEWLNEERKKEEERQQQQEEANKGEERRESNNLVILAIPRGGVIIGDIVATISNIFALLCLNDIRLLEKILNK